MRLREPDLHRKVTKQKRRSKARTEVHYTSPSRPRIIPEERLLSRFYEPLVLLYTLGRTRGEHVRPVMPSQKEIAHLPLLDIRRMLLSDLAYICDYDKGGETVTAIGLQATPQRRIFWIASYVGSKTKIIDFFRSILTQIVHVSAASRATQLATELALQCIAFATPRIRKCRGLLKPLLRKCTTYLAETKQAVEPIYRSNRDAIHVAFGMIRHYIGRLGHHFRAANNLVAYAPRLFHLLHDFEVHSVPVPVKSAVPPPDQMTTLDRILVPNSPELYLYQEALTYMDGQYQVFNRPNRSSWIHAEIQVLEHFYFACDDPFIACSKPACFCCLLYFRHHLGHVVEPVSHNKIYLNWRPPDPRLAMGIISPNHQQDILNAMNQEIRKEALHQLRGNTAPRAWHPDSLTNITRSIQSERGEEPPFGEFVSDSDDNGGVRFEN
ncbi:hypothetical protein J3E72DRAFT_399454 [Bipolaris maydis]|nr:hypothetical protein J3E72DRAFT_399454 [Bipolaris maydis]